MSSDTTNDVALRVRLASSIEEVSAADWNACAADTLPPAVHVLDEDNVDNLSTFLSTRGHQVNPFVLHEFLSSLEASRAVGGRTGWQPRHLLVETSGGDLIGVAPCYVKSHSQGEYVFDHGWAEAFEHAGGSYYPKLQVSVPFTPATGPRLLARPGPTQAAARQALVQALVQITNDNDLSSAHVTFASEGEAKYLGARGFLQRTDQQFTGITTAIPTLTPSWRLSLRASARPFAASARRPCRLASRFTASLART